MVQASDLFLGSVQTASPHPETRVKEQEPGDVMFTGRGLSFKHPTIFVKEPQRLLYSFLDVSDRSAGGSAWWRIDVWVWMT